MKKTFKKVYVSPIAIEKARNRFQKHQGILKTNEAIKCGIHPRTLYQMRDQGIIEQIARGLFHLTKLPGMSNIDLITIAKRAPRGIICLISALDFHELTTQIPHFVDIAYRRDWRIPNIKHPPIKIFRYSKESYNLGIDHHTIDGITVAIYSPEKTIVDCFKFRNKIGLNTAIEALKNYWSRKNNTPNINTVMKYANICRVEKIIRPYLESLINE